MDLKFITNFLENLSPLKINEKNCSKFITPKTSCNKCIEICPTQGINFLEENIVVDNCIECGLCVANCPNHVFELNEKQLLSNCNPNSSLIITCFKFENKIVKNSNIKIVKLKCLHQLYPELITKVISESKKVIIFFDQKYCSSCLNFNFFSSEIYTFLKHFVPEKLSLITDINILNTYLKDNYKEQLPDRRVFFRTIFQESKEMSKEILKTTYESINNDNDETEIKPLKKIYLIEGLKKLGFYKLEETLPYKNLTITKCNFCNACIKLCPTKALEIEETENEKRILFHPEKCTECNICQDVCLLSGIKWGENLTIQDLLNNKPQPLVTGIKKTCQSCQHHYCEYPETDDNHCFWCKNSNSR